MPKNKRKKFAEINDFPNVIQAPCNHDGIVHFPLKGSWNRDFFGNDHPLMLEIGCGKGEYTVGLGQAFPQHNYIGIDIKGDRIWKGAKDALTLGLKNIAFLRTQVEKINLFFDQREVSGIWLTFPDPQEKKIREKKRLTSPHFLEKYKNILIPGSHIHLKTDNKKLYEYTLSVIKEYQHTIITGTDDLYSGNDINEPLLKDIQTYYEKKFLEQGMPIHYLKFTLNESA
ncbi:MAG: tRNA (guanosine(46)-N7)-methyltransferase TrmB [Bacteroidales bacterium]|nr:tRNA (guanosine(46)-N7)-methyltransferase TrmB [Bacteroidales bacterium]